MAIEPVRQADAARQVYEQAAMALVQAQKALLRTPTPRLTEAELAYRDEVGEQVTLLDSDVWVRDAFQRINEALDALIHGDEQLAVSDDDAQAADTLVIALNPLMILDHVARKLHRSMVSCTRDEIVYDITWEREGTHIRVARLHELRDDGMHPYEVVVLNYRQAHVAQAYVNSYAEAMRFIAMNIQASLSEFWDTYPYEQMLNDEDAMDQMYADTSELDARASEDTPELGYEHGYENAYAYTPAPEDVDAWVYAYADEEDDELPF